MSVRKEYIFMEKYIIPTLANFLDCDYILKTFLIITYNTGTKITKVNTL